MPPHAFARVYLLAGCLRLDTKSNTVLTEKGRLRVSIDPWDARMVLAPALQSFLKAHSALSFNCAVTKHREEMMACVDVAVRFGPPDISSLIARKLADVPVVTLASMAYLNARGIPSSPAGLRDHKAILFRDPQTDRAFAWEFARRGDPFQIDVRGRLIVDDPSMALDMCAAGYGVFQSLRFGTNSWVVSGTFVPILSEWSDVRWPLYAYHASRNRPPAAKVGSFLKFMMAACPDQR